MQQFLAAAEAAHDSAARLEVDWHLQWFLTPAEEREWTTLPDSAYGHWVRDRLISRDVRDGQPFGARLAEHFARLEYALENFPLHLPEVSQHGRGLIGVTPPNNLDDTLVRAFCEPGLVPARAFRDYSRWQRELDDRGVIWLRFGKPDQRVVASPTCAKRIIGNPIGPPYVNGVGDTVQPTAGIAMNAREVWMYHIDGKPLLLDFEPEDFSGSVAPTRLVSGVLGSYLCGVDTWRCALTEQSIAGPPLHPEDIEHVREDDQAFISEATTHDDNSVRGERNIAVTAQWHRLWDPLSGAPLALVTWAVPVHDLAIHTDDSTPTAVLDVALRQWDPVANEALDTTVTRRYTVPDTSVKDPALNGFVALRSSAGVSAWSVVVSQVDQRRGRAYDVDTPGLVDGPVVLVRSRARRSWPGAGLGAPQCRDPAGAHRDDGAACAHLALLPDSLRCATPGNADDCGALPGAVGPRRQRASAGIPGELSAGVTRRDQRNRPDTRPVAPRCGFLPAGSATERRQWPRGRASRCADGVAVRLALAKFGVLVTLIGVVPQVLVAQVIRGHTTDSVTHRGISGALVELRDSAGTILQQAFTGPVGEFGFLATAGQRYWLTMAAIGYARHARVLVPDSRMADTAIAILLAPAVVTLPELDALAGKSACGASHLNAETFGGLLDGARTSLQLMDATLKSHQLAFQTRTVHSVVLGHSRDSVVHADTSSDRLEEWPIRSVSLDSLKRWGFQRPMTAREGTGLIWYGPDLEVLFSDWFLDTHCFTLDRKRTTGDTVSIRFAPAGHARNVDLMGELVIDRSTLTLVRLTYAHLHIPDGVPDGAAGGEMAFAEISPGLWVPVEWSIWAPITRTVRQISQPTIMVYGRRGAVMSGPPMRSMSVGGVTVVGRDVVHGEMLRVLPVGP